MSKFSEMFLSRGHYTNWQHSLKVFGRLRLQKTNFKISKQRRYFKTKDLKLLSVLLKPFSMNSSQGRRRTTKAFVQNNLEKNQEKKDIIVAIVQSQQYLICMVGPAGRPSIVQYSKQGSPFPDNFDFKVKANFVESYLRFLFSVT